MIIGSSNGVAKEANNREQELFTLLDVKSKDSLEIRKDVIDMLRSKHFDKIHVIGHS